MVGGPAPGPAVRRGGPRGPVLTPKLANYRVDNAGQVRYARRFGGAGALGSVGAMARAGEEIYNPVQGDWIVFGQTARDTGGALLGGEMVVAPSGGNGLHVHPLPEEHFEVLSGTPRVQLGDEHRNLGKGEEATVPPGTPHRWYNEDDQEKAHVLFELRPALNTEILFENLYGLATDGKTDENGGVSLLQTAVALN